MQVLITFWWVGEPRRTRWLQLIWIKSIQMLDRNCCASTGERTFFLREHLLEQLNVLRNEKYVFGEYTKTKVWAWSSEKIDFAWNQLNIKRHTRDEKMFHLKFFSMKCPDLEDSLLSLFLRREHRRLGSHPHERTSLVSLQIPITRNLVALQFRSQTVHDSLLC